MTRKRIIDTTTRCTSLCPSQTPRAGCQIWEDLLWRLQGWEGWSEEISWKVFCCGRFP